MIKLIIGNKGHGKTKKLIDLVNSCVENSDGNVVCVEKEPKLTYDVSSKARLLETDTYRINGHKAFYGFLAGICAGNYDVTDILVDQHLKLLAESTKSFLSSLKCFQSSQKQQMLISFSQSAVIKKIYQLKSLIIAKKYN